MLVREKTHHINVHICGEGADKVIETIKAAYADAVIITSDDDDFVSYRDTDLSKEIDEEMRSTSPVTIYRQNAGITITDLSKKSGIPKSHLSAIEHLKRSVGVITAKKIGEALGVDYRLFL